MVYPLSHLVVFFLCKNKNTISFEAMKWQVKKCVQNNNESHKSSFSVNMQLESCPSPWPNHLVPMPFTPSPLSTLQWSLFLMISKGLIHEPIYFTSRFWGSASTKIPHSQSYLLLLAPSFGVKCPLGHLITTSINRESPNVRWYQNIEITHLLQGLYDHTPLATLVIMPLCSPPIACFFFSNLWCHSSGNRP